MNKEQIMPYDRSCVLDYLGMPMWSYIGFYLMMVEEFLTEAHPKDPKLVDEVIQHQEFKEWMAKSWIDEENKFISSNHNPDTIRVDWAKKMKEITKNKVLIKKYNEFVYVFKLKDLDKNEVKN